MAKKSETRGVPQAELERRMTHFRRTCVEKGLAMTHQRYVIYRTLAGSDQHLTPEAVFEIVREEIPSVSLATIYKNINTFVEAGVLREVSLPHQSLRLDANLSEHHHVVCKQCRKIFDLRDEDVGPLDLKRAPEGFQVDGFSVQITGLCAACAKPA